MLGLLGDGSLSTSAVPVHVEGVERAVGIGSTWAVDATGRLFQWGVFLGSSDRPADYAIARVLAGLPPIRRVMDGINLVCALAASGALWCWGQTLPWPSIVDDYFRPYEFVPWDESPSPISSEYVEMDSHLNQHACFVRRDGGVDCWGMNTEGQLGRGFLSPFEELGPVLGFP
jgi:alpha-tubulin suppressor-like RCC1 family protein